MRTAGCLECELTWERYSRAVIEHVRISGKLQIAVMRHEAALIEALQSALLAADVERRSAKQIYLDHIATHGEEAVGVQG